MSWRPNSGDSLSGRPSERQSPRAPRRDPRHDGSGSQPSAGQPPARRPSGDRADEQPWRPRRFGSTYDSIAGDTLLAPESSPQASTDLTAGARARLGGRALALAGLVVVAGVVLSRLLGWIRVAVFAAQFGASSSLDAFWAAFRIPDTLFQLVAAGALSSALVPVVAALLANGEPERARRVVSTIANLMMLALVPLALVMWLAAPTLVPVIAPIHDATKLPLEVELTRWMLLSPILLALAAAMTAGLNAAGIFGAPSLAPNVYNLAIIACAIVLTPFMGIYALAAGVVLGGVGHVLTQAPAVRRNGLYQPVLDLKDPAVKETLLLMAPRALGLGATQIVFLVNTFFAVQLDHGMTYYTLAFTALQIPVGLIGVPLGIVLLPPLSQAIARNDTERFGRLVDQSLRMLVFVAIPLAGLMAVLARPILALLFLHGDFGPADLSATIPIFLIFQIGLVAHVLIALLAPIFYAGKDTRTPVTAALVAVAVDVVAAAVLFPFLHIEGLALAIGLGAWAEVSLLLRFMRRRSGFDLGPLGRTVAFSIPGASIASAAALAAYREVDHAAHGSTSILVLVPELAVAGLVALAVYLIWSRLVRLPELSQGLQIARTVLRRG